MRIKRNKVSRKKLDNFTLFLILFFVLLVSLLFFLFPLSNKSLFRSDFGEVSDPILSQGFDPQATRGEYEGKIVSVPPINDTLASVLGETAGNKRIAVDLTNQKVYAFENDSLVYDFTVSTGKWAPTPRGNFSIQRKVRAQKMSGGNPAIGTYYYLPNVPWVMFFGNTQIPWSRGYSFHGTYWHNNFGHPMSHGCINMKTPDAAVLYSWAPEGTPVQIY